MTAPRWTDERAPILLETPGLPCQFVLAAPPNRRTYGKVYLEMRDPFGKTHVISTDDGIEHAHIGGGYEAHCILDSFGSWYLTWHGLNDPETERPTTMQVDVFPAFEEEA